VVHYTRNQYEVVAQIPNGPNSLRTATITPTNQWDATISLDVPIVDARNFLQLKAARSNRQAALADAANTEQDIATQVGTAYYQLVGAVALQATAEQATATAEQNLQTVQTRLQSRLASDLDADRARAEIDHDRQSVEEAKLLAQQARRALHSYSGVEPTGNIPRLATRFTVPIAIMIGSCEIWGLRSPWPPNISRKQTRYPKRQTCFPTRL